jgi:hypothetical protein
MKKIFYSMMVAVALVATSIVGAQNPPTKDKKDAVWVRDKGKSRTTADKNGNADTKVVTGTGQAGNNASNPSGGTATDRNAGSSAGDTSGTMTSTGRRHHLKS